MNNPKKILYIITQGEWGGAQRYVYDLSTNAREQGHDVTVAFGQGENVLGNKLAEKNVSVVQLKNLVRPISLLKDLAAIFEFIKLYKKIKPDVIHLNSTKAGIIGSIASFLCSHHLRSKKYKLIYTVHGWVFNEPLGAANKKIYFWLEKITAIFKNKIICVAETDYKLAINKKIAPAERLICIHNGIDIKNTNFLDTTEAKKELGLPADKIIIGTIANFYETKGLKYFVEAINLLENNHEMPILGVIIGDGELRPQLENLIANYSLQNHFRLLGRKTDAAQYLKAFDIYVCPSVKEGFPYALLEALAASLPIISTRVGGIPEIINHESNGMLINAGDPPALASAIKWFIDNGDDAQNYGQQASEDIKNNFSLEKLVEQTLSLY